jgi:hypothetical protein
MIAAPEDTRGYLETAVGGISIAFTQVIWRAAQTAHRRSALRPGAMFGELTSAPRYRGDRRINIKLAHRGPTRDVVDIKL